MELNVCFVLFLAAMLTCLILGYSLSWALLLALIVFFLLGLKRGYSAKALFAMAWSKIPKTMIVLRILFFVGILTGLWRSSGTISFFIYYGIRSITPQYFVLVAFLLSSLLSFSLGTSFGVALFADRLEGDYFNVVGLPVCRLSQILHQIAPEIMEETP